MDSSVNPKDIASYGELLDELHRQQKRNGNLAYFQDIVYELATTHRKEGDICLGCPRSMTATDGIIYGKYSECSIAICIEKHRITPNLMTRHEMGAQITSLTNKINKLEEQLENIKEYKKQYCGVVESVCSLDPCPTKHFCVASGFTKE